jgi:hypothetical protein
MTFSFRIEVMKSIGQVKLSEMSTKSEGKLD